MSLEIVRRNAIIKKLQPHRMAVDLSVACDSSLIQEYCRCHRCNITLRNTRDGRVLLAFSGENVTFEHALQMVQHAFTDTFKLCEETL